MSAPAHTPSANGQIATDARVLAIVDRALPYLGPAIALDNIATAQLLSALSTVATTAVMVAGGVVCWLLARSEQTAGR